MHIMIIGAAGMIGKKLAQSIAQKATLGGQPIKSLTLVDIIEPQQVLQFTGQIKRTKADLSEQGVAKSLIQSRPDVIFHLAAIVSGEAEADFDKGYRINLEGTRALFDAVRLAGDEKHYKPRLVFASSIAVFGTPMPLRITDTYIRTPLTSYGTQKAICELLLDDYSRRGFFDGVGVRLPTICIRPGKPNKAASGFFSNILREPLVGKTAILPVATHVRHWHASPRSAVGFLTHASTLDTASLGHQRSLNMPGVSATVAEQIEALRRVGGDAAVELIRHEPDEGIEKIVSGWAQGCDAERATQLGFTAENSFDEIIRNHIEDELGGEVGS